MPGRGQVAPASFWERMRTKWLTVCMVVKAMRYVRKNITVPAALDARYVVVGEAFTKLRHDRRVSPRKDAGVAVSVFRLVEEADEVFELRFSDSDVYGRARDILTQYRDQSFSYVDAVAFAVVDSDPSLDQVLTVDGRDFSTYRFAHPTDVVLPRSIKYRAQRSMSKVDSTETP